MQITTKDEELRVDDSPMRAYVADYPGDPEGWYTYAEALLIVLAALSLGSHPAVADGHRAAQPRGHPVAHHRASMAGDTPLKQLNGLDSGQVFFTVNFLAP